MKKAVFGTLIISFLFFGCSASTETTTSNTDSTSSPQVYVFDDISDNIDSAQTVTSEPIIIEETVSTPAETYVYIVQLGAFSSEERANRFQIQNQDKITWPMRISYSNSVNLWVISLDEYQTKKQAEEVRNELWKMDVFKDAFIVTKIK